MNTLPIPKLVIFDCDGTLVDTETLHMDIMFEFLEQHHHNITNRSKIEERGYGRTITDFLHMVEHHFGYALPSTAEQTYKDMFERALLKQGSDIRINGALRTTTRLAKSFPICVATNGEVSFTDIKLKAAGFYDELPDLKFYTKDLVQNPKPAPDLFLYVAKEYKTDPRDCLVIEDSVTGVTAAISAGMTCIGFIGCAHDKDKARKDLETAGAHLVIDDYKDFPSLT